MKRNISITIDEVLVNRIDNYGKIVRRSRSETIETIVKYFLDAHDKAYNAYRDREVE